ncbi:hypothetical protein VB005_02458 [Metarhizium brunneum]
MVAQCLLVTVEDIADYNKDRSMVVGSVHQGEKYKIPHTQACSSASWRTETSTISGSAVCSAFLEFSSATTLVTSNGRTSSHLRPFGDTYSTASGGQFTATQGAGSSVTTHPSGKSSVPSDSHAAGSSATTSDSQSPTRIRPVTEISTGTNDASSSAQRVTIDGTLAGTSTVSAPTTTTSSASASTSSGTGINKTLRCYHKNKNKDYFNPNETYITDKPTQHAYASEFCKQIPDAPFDGSEMPSFYQIYFGDQNRGYYFNIEFRGSNDKCVGPKAGISSQDCSETMRDNYDGCDNGGLGGETDAACLTLRYQPVNVLNVTRDLHT